MRYGLMQLPQTRQRAHAERMLARAERRSRQAFKLVEKWKATLAVLDRQPNVAWLCLRRAPLRGHHQRGAKAPPNYLKEAGDH
jgi:hypothetical protein